MAGDRQMIFDWLLNSFSIFGLHVQVWIPILLAFLGGSGILIGMTIDQ